jgi:predicted phosphatase
MKAEEYYEENKFKDSWGIDVVYPPDVKKIIEIAKLEGILIGVNEILEMHGQGAFSFLEMMKTKEYFENELKSFLADD